MPTITNHLLYIHHRRHLNGNRRHSGIFIAFLYPTIASQSPVLLEEDDRYRGKRGTGPPNFGSRPRPNQGRDREEVSIKIHTHLIRRPANRYGSLLDPHCTVYCIGNRTVPP